MHGQCVIVRVYASKNPIDYTRSKPTTLNPVVLSVFLHDIDLLIGAGCVNKVEVAYAFGHELRGLSPAGRRAVETGQCQVAAEISNAGYQWRFLAGMMGIPFIPSRTMLKRSTGWKLTPP